jgi:assimilatory nitrate reductase catalytic subunit
MGGGAFSPSRTGKPLPAVAVAGGVAVSGTGETVPQAALKTTCAYCGVGCGVEADVKDRDARLLSVRGDAGHPANLGRLCSKGTALNEIVATGDRLLRPRINGREVFWGEALDAVAAKLAQVRHDHGPDAIAFYVSGQLLTEDYYVANKLVKGFIGTANIDTNSRLCMASTVVAQQRAFGEDVVPGCYEDLELADLVVLVGSNTAWCHPVLFQRIKAARERRGTKVVVIDPRRTATCEIADQHLAILPGSDAALFNGLLCWLADQGALDASFIAMHTAGYGGALNAARADAGDIDALAARCGVAVNELKSFFRLFANTEKTVTSWSQGVNQSSGGTDKVNAIINCHLATGRIGKPGAAPLSFTGQPNAMGGREVGGLATQLAAHMAIEDAAARAAVARFWQAREMPAARGLKAVDMFEAVRRGEVKFLWVIGTNPAASLPHAERVREAIAACEFVVVSDCVNDNDTLRHAQVALPATTWGEKDGTVTNSERRISRQRALLAPAGEAKADWWILAQVARRLGYTAQFNYTKPADVFREHAALSALGNELGKPRRLFHLGELATLTDAAYDALQPVQWPVRAGATPAATPAVATPAVAAPAVAAPAAAPGTATRNGAKLTAPSSARLFGDGRFMHGDGRARFVAIAAHRPVNSVRDDFPFVLNTHRLRDQWHTMTRTGAVPRLVRHSEQPALDVHPDDAARAGLRDGAIAEVRSAQGRALLRVAVNTAQRAGEVSAPMHWTRSVAPASCVNALVNAVCDPQSGQPEFKHTPVQVLPWPAVAEAVLIVRVARALPEADYLVRISESGCTRLQVALADAPTSPAAWLQAQLARVLPEGVAARWMAREDVANGRAALACFAGDDLVAFAALQTGAAPARVQWLQALVRQGVLDDADRNWLLTDLLPPGVTPCSRQLCACFQVTEKTLRDALRDGCTTVEALVQRTQAGSKCGTCLPEIAMLAAKPA